jgi:hypothetical protein
MQVSLEEPYWDLLLERIKDGECTPFLGAGACAGVLPLGATIAQRWADKEGYPLDDCTDLARVAQFLAVQYDAIRPKRDLIRQFSGVRPPDFSNPYEPHRVLAELPLPVYITTNYDNFLFQALSQAEYKPGLKKMPIREVCRWNKYVQSRLRNQQALLKPASYARITEKSPVIFHLHGHTELAESMVLTEDDYLDFLVNVSKDEDLLPPRIQEAMAGTSLLFLGYRLSDWNFRVLFRSVVGYLEKSIARAHISVQLVPLREGHSEAQREKAQAYLQRYFGDLKIQVYWGTATSFAKELKDRWQQYSRQQENQDVTGIPAVHRPTSV